MYILLFSKLLYIINIIYYIFNNIYISQHNNITIRYRYCDYLCNYIAVITGNNGTTL